MIIYKNIDALESLTNIGDLINIIDNDALPNLNGLESLSSNSLSMYIAYNDALTSLNGLENITSLDDLNIYCNDALTNLYGLNNLTSVNGFKIFGNDNLISLSGLDNLTTVGGSNISRNDKLTDFNGLDNLVSVTGHLHIGSNDALTSFHGLENLSSIGGHLYIGNNDALTNLDALDSLTTIGSYLWISKNDILASLSGLDNINPNSITDLDISENGLLSVCDVNSICEYMENPNGIIEIYSNAVGCNSPEEVEEACDTVGIYKINLETEFSVYPNPTEKCLYIKQTKYNSNYSYNIKLRNIYGQLVQEEKGIRSSHHTINIAHLKPGVYFYVIKEKGEVVQQGKLIKK